MEKKYECDSLILYPKYFACIFCVSIAAVISLFFINNPIIFALYFFIVLFILYKFINYMKIKLKSTLVLFDSYLKIEVPIFSSFLNITKENFVISYSEIIDVFICDKYTNILKFKTKSSEIIFGIPYDVKTNAEILNFLRIKVVPMAEEASCPKSQ